MKAEDKRKQILKWYREGKIKSLGDNCFTVTSEAFAMGITPSLVAKTLKAKDLRRVNKVWEGCNPKGEWFTYARIGSGKNSYIATLSVGAMAQYYQRYIGQVYRKEGLKERKGKTKDERLRSK